MTIDDSIVGHGDTDSAEDDAPLSFDTWAPAAARMDQLSPEAHAELLGELGIEPLAWALANRYWNDVIAQEMLDRRLDRAILFAQHCAREAQRQEAARRAVEGPAEPPAAPKAEPRVEVRPIDIKAALAAAREALPRVRRQARMGQDIALRVKAR